MTVGELLRAFARAMPPHDRPALVSDARSLEVDCSGIAYDSRRVAPGMVFVAVPGMKADGLQFVSQAITSGAAAIVAEQPAPTPAPGPWVVVTSARLALVVLATEFFDHRPMPCASSAAPAQRQDDDAFRCWDSRQPCCVRAVGRSLPLGARSMDATLDDTSAPELHPSCAGWDRGCGALLWKCRRARFRCVVSRHSFAARRHESDARPSRFHRQEDYSPPSAAVEWHRMRVDYQRRDPGRRH